MEAIRFFHFRKKYNRFFVLGLGALVLTNIFDVLPPLILKRGVDQIQAHANQDELLKTALLFSVIIFFLGIFRYQWRTQWGGYHFNAARDLREMIFSHLTKMGPTFYREYPVGELMSRVINDVEAVRMGIGPGVLVLADALLYFATIPVVMFMLSPRLTVQTMVCLPILPFFIHWLGNIIHRRFIVVQNRFAELSSFIQENISGIRLIKTYAQEENQHRILQRKSEKIREAAFDVARADSFMHPTMEFTIATGVVLLLWLGSRQMADETLTVGTFVAFHRYIAKMVWPMTAVGWGTSLVQQGRASLKRVNNILLSVPEVHDSIPAGQMALFDLHGPIEVRKLSFGYPRFPSENASTRQVLHEISFELSPGEIIGLVGPVGSGKTTLAQLLCRLYAIERGHVFINGHDINDIPLKALRRHITLVPQDAFLFSEKIYENIAFGAETLPALNAVVDVAQVARLDDEIARLPKNYETQLGERGVNLSGGQKQRMTIMRALLRQSPVVILDDSLSAVDAETEKQILERMEGRSHAASARPTTIIISHRLTSLMRCDRILVLNEGRIEAIGRPRELLQTSELFREIATHQGALP